MNSEKLIEKTLNTVVTKAGGWSIKLLSTFISGLPDRLVLLPGGVVFFMELKSTGKKATTLQKLIHARIRRLGFEVYVIDTLDELHTTLNTYIDV